MKLKEWYSYALEKNVKNPSFLSERFKFYLAKRLWPNNLEIRHCYRYSDWVCIFGNDKSCKKTK